MNKGKIVQVMGPVVDVKFDEGQLPEINEALEVENEGRRCVMEVAQHVGNKEVRCIMLSASEGLYRDMEVTATGKGIQVPVGEKTLGRLFNVLGETIDKGESLEKEEHWVIHRNPPSLKTRARWWRFWKRESKSSTYWRLMPRVVKSVCSEEPA